MTVADIGDLIADLERIGVRLWVSDDQLRFRAPKGVLTEERLAGLRASKADLVEHLRSGGRPTDLVGAPALRHEPFPVTDVQAAYLLGRGTAYAYGGTGCHGYGELSYAELDPRRLAAAWHALIERHDMLRAVVEADGSQRVLAAVPPLRIEELDLRGHHSGDVAAALDAVRAEMDHRVFATDRWPLFEVRLTRTDERVLLHVSVDFLIADFISIQIVLDEMHRLYHRPDDALPAIDVTFRDYLMAERGLREAGREADRDYWLARLESLPAAPRLPTVDRSGPDADAPAAPAAPARFRRWETLLPQPTWAALRRRAGERGLTPSGAALAAYAEVIGAWSRGPRFTLDVTLLNRAPLHPHVNRVVGDFTGVELLAVDVDVTWPFGERARRLQAQLWQDMDHRSFTGVDLIREISRREGAEAALFPVVFTSAIGLTEAGEASGAGDAGDAARAVPTGELGRGISQTPQVWIDCQNIERPGGLATNWDVREGVFPAGLVDDMFAAYVALLNQLADDDEPWESTAPVPLPGSQAERRRRVNDTAAELPTGLLHDRVVAQALRTPDRTALVAGGRSMTYAELLGHATSVADRLTGAGLSPGELVAVAMEKGCEQIVAVLGILLGGGAYLPVEMNQPALRRQQILEIASVRHLLTQSHLVQTGEWPAGLTVSAVDTLPPVPARPLATTAGPDDLAYTIFTSGSTGTPKGVMISHRSALNTVMDINERFAVTADDRVLGLSSLGFDLSVYDIFGPLAVGGCLVLPAPDRRGDPSHWGDLVATHGVTIWNSVPAQLQMLHDYLSAAPMVTLPTLRLGLLSGDWIPVGLPGQIRHRVPGLRLVSLGGATEAAIWSIYHPIGDVLPEWRSVPYGRPLANQTFHVLDATLRPVPDWVPGELYIGGVGLALGYLGDVAKTAERFGVHPNTGERLYRTGDLGRYLPDGDIEFLGREDSQVKIRGYRIELAEVEAALQTHPAVGNAAVIVDGDRPLERRLVGFVEPGARSELAPAAVMVALTEDLARAAMDAGEETLAGVDRSAYLDFARRLDEVALLSMVDTFVRAGLFPDPTSAHTEADIRAAVKLVPRHARLLRRWLRSLVAEGWLAVTDGAFRLARQGADVDRAWAGVDDVAAPDDAALIAYFRTSIAALPALLRGEEDPLALLFPEGRLDVSRELYENALFNRWANVAAAALVRAVARSRVSDGPLRVLEVGAGGGGTTRAVLEALAGVPVDYTCTDLSPFFLNELRERLGARPDVTFAVYDLDRDFRASGLLPNAYDVVIAGDVLHATTDVGRAVDGLRQLLAPDGWLVALEMTRDHYQIMTSLELLVRLDETVADVTDLRRATDRVFLDREEWPAVLREAGADLTLCLPGPDVTDLADTPTHRFIGELGMCVVAGRFKAHRLRIDPADLGVHLAARLPVYMVPSHVQIVDALPLTANGKVDRASLARWVPRRPVEQASLAEAVPAGALEETVAAIWAQALRQPHIGRDENLFDIGGDSLVAAQITGRVLEEVPEAAGLFFDQLLRQLLEQPTIAELARHLATSTASPPTAPTQPAGAVVAAHVLTTIAGGDGAPTLVLDAAAWPWPPLVVLAATAFTGPVVGLPGAGDGADTARLAAEYARVARAAGHDRLRVAGHGPGAALAMEVARAAADGGASVEALVLVAPTCPTGALPALYSGDIVVLLPPGQHGDADIAFWQDICLGDVSVAELPAVGEASGALVGGPP